MTLELSEKEEQNPPKERSQDLHQEILSKEENTQILIKNIPETTTEEMLLKIFEKYGKILKIKIEQDMDGKPTGEAIIEFEKKQEKDLVVNSNEQIEIEGKKIEIKDLNNEGLTLFVGNIPYSSRVEEIEEFFSECGKVDVKFFYINNSFKGYAYVTFQDENAVEIALKKNGEKLGEREIKIEKLKSRNYIQIQRGGRRDGRRGGYKGRGRGGSFGHFDRERKEEYFREKRERDRYRYRDSDRGRSYNRFRDNRERDREWNRDRRERSRERSRSREYNRIRDRNERDRHRDFERDREERDRNEKDRNDRERERDRNDRERDKQRENERHRDYERDRSNKDRERRHSNYEEREEW